MAPKDAVVPVRPITAVSANPRNGAAELAKTMGQVLWSIVRYDVAESWGEDGIASLEPINEAPSVSCYNHRSKRYNQRTLEMG